MPVIKWIVSGASEYIAYGSRAQRFLERLGANKSKISQFINSVDVDFFVSQSNALRPKREQFRKKLGFKADDFVYLFVGQLIERKGVRELVKAFSEIKDKNKKLLIIGSGKLDYLFEQFENNVIHLNHLEYHQLPEYYVASDCLILPSKEEVWGLVVNEALACGTPVLASTAVGAAEDLIKEGKTGLIYNLDNNQGLIKAMMNMKRTVYDVGYLQEEALKTHPRIMAEKVFGKFS